MKFAKYDIGKRSILPTQTDESAGNWRLIWYLNGGPNISITRFALQQSRAADNYTSIELTFE
jgi:hypothetical protein